MLTFAPLHCCTAVPSLPTPVIELYDMKLPVFDSPPQAPPILWPPSPALWREPENRRAYSGSSFSQQ